jgi:YfiH family protein
MAFGLPSQGPVTTNQVHGNSVFIVEDRGAGGPHQVEADAIVTNVPGVALGVLTADCLPILLFDPARKVAGAVHAGWKGTVKKVTTAAVEAFAKNFGSNPEDLFSALGPCIGPCCYRVDDEVTAQYKRTFGDWPGYLTKGPGSRLSILDIRAANMDQLLNAGLVKENISTESVCTSCRNELFFSYRKEGPSAGRQLNFVMIKE